MPRHPYYPLYRSQYEQMVSEIPFKETDHQFIGSNQGRFDGYPKCSGRAKYPSDFQLPGMLWAKCLKSPFAHARIVNIDISKAEALAGVHAIFTYETEKVTLECPKGLNEIAVTGGCKLLPQEANWEGETVGAAVCADSEEICDEAINLLEIEWEELPFVLTIEDAIASGAPQINENYEGNIWHTATNSRNRIISEEPYEEDPDYDVEQGFIDGNVVVEGQCRWPWFPMHGAEPNTVVAKWDGDQLTLWPHTQRPASRPSQIASFLGIPASKVNLVLLYQGGMFGQNHLYNSESARLDAIAALFARKTGKPVKMQMSRRDYFYGSDVEAIIDYKIGVNNDGTITAVKANCLFNGGSPGGSGTLWSAVNHAMNWVVMDLKCATDAENTTVITNKCPVWWWRSEQNVNARLLQHIIERAANAIDADPSEVMLKNARLPEPSLKEVIETAKERIDFDSKWHAPGTKTLPNGKLHGLGFYFGHEWGNYTDGLVSLGLRINMDGTVTLIGAKDNLGCTENTTYAMIVAEEMGVKFEDINYPLTDTNCGFAPQGSGGAAGLHGSSWCCAKLGITAKQKVLEMAAPGLGVTPEALDMKDSIIFVKDDPTKALPLSSLFRISDGSGTWLQISAETKGGYWSEENVMMIFTPMHNYQAHFVEVEVDSETGDVEVAKVVNVNDVGKAIRPATVEYQQYGGTYMALGRALLQDDMIFDRSTGVNLTSDLVNDHVAINLDSGPIDTVIKEVGHGDGPYGLTGIGEDTTDCCAPAAVSAVNNAVGEYIDPPITPEKVLKALGKI